MKIIDKNGNNIIGTPNLKRAEKYQIQFDFMEAIVASYEVTMNHAPDPLTFYNYPPSTRYGVREGSRDNIVLKGFFQELSI